MRLNIAKRTCLHLVTSTSKSKSSTSTVSPSPMGHINPVFLYGTIALLVVVGVGLTARAIKRAAVSLGPVIEVKRHRSSRSIRSLRSRGSRSIPRNDAEVKLVDDERVIV